MRCFEIQSLWNPFRDWNYETELLIFHDRWFKASETLLGIETFDCLWLFKTITQIQSLWNPFRDWNNFCQFVNSCQFGFKASETLLGIETATADGLSVPLGRFKASETLLGIETLLQPSQVRSQREIQSLWNPFRDWNREEILLDGEVYSVRFKASETLLGIETQVDESAGKALYWFKASETLLGIETQWLLFCFY